MTKRKVKDAGAMRAQLKAAAASVRAAEPPDPRIAWDALAKAERSAGPGRAYPIPAGFYDKPPAW